MTNIEKYKKLSLTHKIVLWAAFLFLFVPGAIGFIQKLMLFIKSFNSGGEGTFTILPVLNYLLVAAGMLCLFAWAVAHGMFRNIEAPKYDHLEHERELDREDGIDWE